MGLPGAATAVSRLLPFVISAGLMTGGSLDATRTFPFNKGTLPDGDTLIDSMCKVDIDAKELMILSKHWTHKLVVFVYPPGSNRLWTWDPDSKSRELSVDPIDSQAVANAWTALVAPNEHIVTAFYQIPPTANHCLSDKPQHHAG